MGDDYRLGDWLVRPRRDCIERGGKTVRIKPKAMAVLECLARASGEVVTRNDLFDAVWPGAIVSDATLTQCIVELRQAFGDSAKQPQIIETIPRVGFRLIPAIVALEEDTQRPATTASRSPWSDKRVGILVAGAALLAFVTYWYPDRTGEEQHAVVDNDEIALAVLPFADLSEGQDQSWLTRGLTDLLINRLARLEGLKVTTRSAALLYEGKSELPEHIGAELGVDFMLEGSVARSADQLRIATQLVDARDGSHLWSWTYEEPIDDIPAVQDMIVESVAFALGITFDVGPFPDLTTSVEAFFLSSHGNSVLISTWKGGSAESMLEGLEYYKRAVRIDPEFGIAWGGLAYWYGALDMLRDDRLKLDWSALETQAAGQAQRLIPGLAPGAIAAVRQYTRLRQWAEADEEMGRAWEQGAGHNTYFLFPWGVFLAHVGRSEEALNALQRSRMLDPEGPQAIPFRERLIARMFLLQGRSGDALDAYERAWNEDSMIRRLGGFEGLYAALAVNERENILAWLVRAEEHAQTEEKAWIRAMKERLDDHAAALAWLREAFDLSEGGYGNPFTDPFIMNWAAWFGDAGLALEAMRRSDDPMWFWTPLLAEARVQPEFKEIANDFGLVDYWREYSWADVCRPAGGNDFTCD